MKRFLIKALNALATTIEERNLITREKIRVAKLTDKERGYEWALEELYGKGKTINEVYGLIERLDWGDIPEFDLGAKECLIEETKFLNRKNGIRGV